MLYKTTNILLTTILICIVNFTKGQSVVYHNEQELISILKGKSPIVDEVLANPERYHLQINFTTIQEYPNAPVLNEYSLNKIQLDRVFKLT